MSSIYNNFSTEYNRINQIINKNSKRSGYKLSTQQSTGHHQPNSTHFNVLKTNKYLLDSSSSESSDSYSDSDLDVRTLFKKDFEY